MTVSELFNVLLGTSKHTTSVRILSCGAEVVNTLLQIWNLMKRVLKYGPHDTTKGATC